MYFPQIQISKRDRRGYKSNVAAWEAIRAGGVVRFVLVRGILMRGLPTAIIAFVGVSFYLNDFRFDTKFLSDPWLIVIILVMAVVFGIRLKLFEWLDNEREFTAWKLYKSKGNILNDD